MFTSARVFVLAALAAAGLFAASASAQAQHRRAYGGVYHGGYAPSYYHGYGGVYAPHSLYRYPPAYVYPATGYHVGGAAYYQPYAWHGGAVYTPSYHGTYYHVGPAYAPAAGYYRGYIIRH